jgi:probable phosphoglycerate mutase
VGILGRGPFDAARREGHRLIYLIRHGETALNAARVFQPPDTPLSERGIAQASRLGERLRAVGIRRILASDMRRAEMTAQAIRSATDAPLVLDSLLHERNFGDLRGTPYSELTADPFAADYLPPGGESWETFHARVDRAWQRATDEAQDTDGHLAVVTHGLVCHSVVSRLARLADGVDAAGGGWLNTSVTILEAGEAWTVTLLNCAAHLDGVDEASDAHPSRQGGRA